MVEKVINNIVCENNCLYGDIDLFICNDCNEVLKNNIGYRFSLFFRKRFNMTDLTEKYDLYYNGIKHGLLEASAIVQGLNEDLWFFTKKEEDNE